MIRPVLLLNDSIDRVSSIRDAVTLIIMASESLGEGEQNALTYLATHIRDELLSAVNELEDVAGMLRSQDQTAGQFTNPLSQAA
jgi:hypothetical protein